MRSTVFFALSSILVELPSARCLDHIRGSRCRPIWNEPSTRTWPVRYDGLRRALEAAHLALAHLGGAIWISAEVGPGEETHTDLVRILPRQEAFDLLDEPASPIVKWAGGKRSLRRQLLALAPAKFGTYFEPFLGGATFYLSLASSLPISRAILNDANSELIQLYQTVRAQPEAVMQELDLFKPDVSVEQSYYRIRDLAPESLVPAKRAARFIYLNKTCYNGLYRVNRNGQFNVPFGRYARPPALYNRANLRRVADLLQGVDLRHGDFADALQEAGEGDFVYLDPPYVPLTQTASFTRYTSGAFGAEDQRRLAEVFHTLARRGAMVLLSNSETRGVRDLYEGHGYFIDVVYAPRNINSDANGRQKIAELAIRSYPLDDRVSRHAETIQGTGRCRHDPPDYLR